MLILRLVVQGARYPERQGHQAQGDCACARRCSQAHRQDEFERLQHHVDCQRLATRLPHAQGHPLAGNQGTRFAIPDCPRRSREIKHTHGPRKITPFSKFHLRCTRRIDCTTTTPRYSNFLLVLPTATPSPSPLVLRALYNGHPELPI